MFEVFQWVDTDGGIRLAFAQGMSDHELFVINATVRTALQVEDGTATSRNNRIRTTTSNKN